MRQNSVTILSNVIKKQGKFGKQLGIKIIGANKNHLEAELLVKNDFANRNGVMHGGAIMAFADDLGGTATYINLDDSLNTTTIESKTNFVRPIRIGDTIRAEVDILNHGKKLVVLQTKIFRSDKKLATIVTQTQMVLKFIK